MSFHVGNFMLLKSVSTLNVYNSSNLNWCLFKKQLVVLFMLHQFFVVDFCVHVRTSCAYANSMLLLTFLSSSICFCYMTCFSAHLCLQLCDDDRGICSVCLQRVLCICVCGWWEVVSLLKY